MSAPSSEHSGRALPGASGRRSGTPVLVSGVGASEGYGRVGVWVCRKEPVPPTPL